jgi:hypothetical protein
MPLDPPRRTFALPKSPSPKQNPASLKGSGYPRGKKAKCQWGRDHLQASRVAAFCSTNGKGGQQVPRKRGRPGSNGRGSVRERRAAHHSIRKWFVSGTLQATDMTVVTHTFYFLTNTWHNQIIMTNFHNRPTIHVP